MNTNKLLSFDFAAISSSSFNSFCNSGNLPYFNSAALFSS